MIEKNNNKLKIDELSETEKELYKLLKDNNGKLSYLVTLSDKPKLMGAVGKLVSKHIAKIERDHTEPKKQYRKKLILIDVKE